jgi:hypothetical protein
MGQHLAQNLIDLGRFGLAAQAFPELRFDHPEDRFRVRPFMVMGLKFGFLKLVEMIKPLPEFALSRWSRLVLFSLSKRDVRLPALDQNETPIAKTVVALIHRKLHNLHIKPSGDWPVEKPEGSTAKSVSTA